MASDPCGMATFFSEPAPSLFIVSNSVKRVLESVLWTVSALNGRRPGMWPSRTVDQKEENMDKVSQGSIIGIDVSRDWLNIHCFPDNSRLRLPNTDEGHVRLGELALSHNALVCFEATGGQEWRLWAALDAAGIKTRQLPPAQTEPLMRHWFEHNGERLCCQPGHAGQN